MNGRSILMAHTALSLGSLTFGGLAWAQNYPTRPITVISSAAQGSSGDAALRIITVRMSEGIGKPVIVESRAAARGAQAHQAFSKAAPDGYTLTYGTSSTYVYARFLYKNLTFDVLKDYTPVTMAVTSPSYVTVSAGSNITSLKQLIDTAKAQPGKLEYGSTGLGSYFHLAGEALKNGTGIDILHVPYAQSNFPQLVNDWSSGRIAVWFPTYGYLPANMSKIRVLAILDGKRSAQLPEVPAIVELLPGYRPFSLWLGFFGPSGLPPALASRVAGEVRTALLAPENVSKLGALAFTPVGNGPEEFGSMLRQEIATIGKLVEATGLKPE